MSESGLESGPVGRIEWNDGWFMAGMVASQDEFMEGLRAGTLGAHFNLVTFTDSDLPDENENQDVSLIRRHNVRQMRALALHFTRNLLLPYKSGECQTTFESDLDKFVEFAESKRKGGWRWFVEEILQLEGKKDGTIGTLLTFDGAAAFMDYPRVKVAPTVESIDPYHKLAPLAPIVESIDPVDKVDKLKTSYDSDIDDVDVDGDYDVDVDERGETVVRKEEEVTKRVVAAEKTKTEQAKAKQEEEKRKQEEERTKQEGERTKQTQDEERTKRVVAVETTKQKVEGTKTEEQKVKAAEIEFKRDLLRSGVKPDRLHEYIGAPMTPIRPALFSEHAATSSAAPSSPLREDLQTPQRTRNVVTRTPSRNVVTGTPLTEASQNVVTCTPRQTRSSVASRNVVTCPSTRRSTQSAATGNKRVHARPPNDAKYQYEFAGTFTCEEGEIGKDGIPDKNFVKNVLDASTCNGKYRILIGTRKKPHYTAKVYMCNCGDKEAEGAKAMMKIVRQAGKPPGQFDVYFSSKDEYSHHVNRDGSRGSKLVLKG